MCLNSDVPMETKMDLIRMYVDQESQSSNSCEDPNATRFNNGKQKAECSNDVLNSNGERSMCPPYSRPQCQQINFSQWFIDIDRQLHSCLGSLIELTKTRIYDSLDYFIDKLTKDYDRLIKPKIAEVLVNYIRTYLYVYKYLNQTNEKVRFRLGNC